MDNTPFTKEERCNETLKEGEGIDHKLREGDDGGNVKEDKRKRLRECVNWVAVLKNEQGFLVPSGHSEEGDQVPKTAG